MAKILIVDDEPCLLAVLKMFLEAHGHAVVALSDSDRAEEVMRSHAFDLMISDVRMRPIHGLTLLKIAREKCPHMGVIMMTAFQDDDTIEEAERLGALAYFSKPFDNQEVIRIINEALTPA